MTLTPSLGPPPVPVPDVTKDTQEAATSDAACTPGSRSGAVKQVYSDTVPEGRVVKQDPADGKAPEGSAVDLWISKGHAPEAIPGRGRQDPAGRRDGRCARPGSSR